MISDSGPRSAEADESARNSAVTREVVRYLTGSTGLISVATSFALPVGIVSALITIRYLAPSEYGEFGLLMVFASFLTVMYNVGLLHGTFLWVYGTSGEGGDDLELEGVSRSDVAVQRKAMGTGLILTLLVSGSGTAIFFIFQKPLAAGLLGNPHAAHLIGWAAISGGSGSIYRLTCNVFRFERRRVGFAVATVARPIGVLVGSSALLIAGYGVRGALIGTAAPTILCAIGCMLMTRRSYALTFSPHDARQIARRGGAVVIPVLALFVLHNGDIYILSIWIHGAPLGVYRLASRLGSPPSYLASAFIISWSPLERSALGAAWYKARGQLPLRSGVLTYYVLSGLSIVVIFVLLSRVLVLAAPASYASAAKVVPLIALAFVTYGAYIVVLRTARPARLILWYSLTSVLAAAVFVGSSFVLIPTFGVYGAPVALTLGMSVGIGILLQRNSRSAEPLPVEYRKVVAGLLVAAGISGAALAGDSGDLPLAVVTTTACLIAYLPALVLVRAIPRAHLSIVRGIVLAGRSNTAASMSVDKLPEAERDALRRFVGGTLQESDQRVDYARLTRALRRLGGIGDTSAEDAQIGMYLTSREPESVRDFQLHALIVEGVDAFDLHHLDQLARAARRGRLTAPPRSGARHTRAHRHTRRLVRARVRSLEGQERLRLVRTLLTAGEDPRHPHAVGGENPSALALARAVRALRHSLGLGMSSPTDAAIGRALWTGEDPELSASGRTEFRELKRATKLTYRLSLEDERVADRPTTAEPTPPAIEDSPRELATIAIDSALDETYASEPVG